ALAAPRAALLAKTAVWLLFDIAFYFAVALGLASLLGSRTQTIAIMLGWRLAVMPLLLSIKALGVGRDALPQAAFEHLAPGGIAGSVQQAGSVSMTSATAVVVLLAWTAVALALGAWRAATRDPSSGRRRSTFFSMVWNWLRRHPVLVDWALVLLVLTVHVGNAFAHEDKPAGIGFALLQALPLAFRRRWPVLVLALVTAGAFGAAQVQGGEVPFALFIAVYTVAAHVARRRSAWAPGAAIGEMALAFAIAGSSAYAALILFAAAWVLGDNMRTRRAYFAELEDKADRLEREREANVRRAAAEEQARISRELHDVIAHNVSVMTVQAAAARDVFDNDPAS